MEIRFKRQNEDKTVLHCNNYYYKCFRHPLISTIYSHFFFPAVDFDAKLLKDHIPKFGDRPRVTLSPKIVRPLDDIIMRDPKLPVPVI